MIFVFRISGGIKFRDLSKGPRTGSPSLITVRTECLFAFNSDTVSSVSNTDEGEAESVFC